MTEQQLADFRTARKILAIDAASTAGGRGWIHPRFQFDDSGQPFPEIALVLEAFGDADPIAVCDWLAEPNPILDGRPPMHFWLTDRARIVQSAQAAKGPTLSQQDLVKTLIKPQAGPASPSVKVLMDRL
jgi:hypothetical protein